jgi:hypothetical protein
VTADEIKILGDSEMETGRSLAIGMGIVSFASLVMIGAFTAAVVPNLLHVAFFGIVAFGAAAATGVLFWAYRRRNELIAAFKARYLPAPLPAPAAISAPALPPALENAKVTDANGVGGYAERPILGYPAILIEYMCNYLANKNDWTERRMAKMQVPYMYPLTYFGKAEKGTPYYDFFNHEQGMFCRSGILIERGGPGNPPGKLTTTNAVEMMERIKSLPDNQSS